MFLSYKHSDGKGKAATWRASKESFDRQSFVDGSSKEIDALPTSEQQVDPDTLAVVTRVKSPGEVTRDADIVAADALSAKAKAGTRLTDAEQTQAVVLWLKLR